MRGVRGATTVGGNEASQIVARTAELLSRMIAENGIQPGDVASAVFTATGDLDAEFPAVAVRSVEGWADVPLLCSREIPVPGSLGLCVRILLHWNTDRSPGDVRHVFLRGARELRPQWAKRISGDDGEQPVRLQGGKP